MESRQLSRQLRKTEYDYQCGTIMSYEEFLYDLEGKLLIYFRKDGTGSISKIQNMKWDREERYYFKGEKLIYMMSGGKTYDNPRGKSAKRGKEIVEHGKIMKELAEIMSLQSLGACMGTPLHITDFSTGKGIQYKPGKLGMSLQASRQLTDIWRISFPSKNRLTVSFRKIFNMGMPWTLYK